MSTKDNVIKEVKCTCKGCTRRKVGCHATCEEYKAFVEYNNYLRERIREQRRQDALDLEFVKWIRVRRRK